MEETYRAVVKSVAKKARESHFVPVKPDQPGPAPQSVDPEPGYETGGFDIMKQLVRKQHRQMDVRKTAE